MLPMKICIRDYKIRFGRENWTLETKSTIKIDTKEKCGKGMEKLFFFLLALELIYEVLRTTPFPGYGEIAVGNLLNFSGTQTESIISAC